MCIRLLVHAFVLLAFCMVAAAEEQPYVVFLGTGAADIETPKADGCENCRYIREHGGRNWRRFSSLYISPGLVIDFSTTGMDSLKNAGILPADIGCLLITHSHGDHFNAQAVAELAQARALSGKPPLQVCGNSTMASALRKHLDSQEKQVPISITQLTPFQDFEACGWKCKAVAANHSPDDEQCLLYALSRNGKALVYATDTTWFPIKTFYALKDMKLDLAVVEGTFGPKTEPDYLLGHMNFDMDRLVSKLLVGQKTLKPGGTFALTHLSLHWVRPHDLIADNMKREGILIPYDGLKVAL